MIDKVALKISQKDWIYIISIGAIFGLLIGVLLYYIDEKLQYQSTILFGFFTGLSIASFSSFFITVSNNFILPHISQKFWYLISFGFSFYSGVFGFLFVYLIYYSFHLQLAETISRNSTYLTFIIGFLTFLIGLILHKFISMKYKNESIKTEAISSELKVLESELNPHFLFNALNSMSELVHIDANKAEKSILNLAKFLRNAISKERMVSLENELKMVQTYVDIENIRFSDKIILKIYPYNIKGLFIPKFSIQLLVENAIKHGYTNKELHIDVIVKDDKITVQNDGKLPQVIKEGLGLSNLKKRLEFLDVGVLKYFIHDDKIIFEIRLDNENTNS